ncbi:MAG: formylglycine-generating enzyme family protein [Prosthecobacter sp.]
MPFRLHTLFFSCLGLLLTLTGTIAHSQEPNAQAPQSGRKSTLGMRFVAVPGTTVLFSAYETRVAEWNQFLRARRYPWSFEPHFKQDENHPVVGVNLQDAIAFCNWLTEKERDENLLNNAQSYRLPTPEEWDAAAGLAMARKGAAFTAEDKLADSQTFLWGLLWPPPVKAANYADREIEGYSDGYEYTAPVGQFTPTQEGLYDLAGNVWEWTDKPDVKSLTNGILRGGSWAYFRKECLVSAYRYTVPADLRMPTIGFRCVFEDKQRTAILLAEREATNKQNLQDQIRKMQTTDDADKAAVEALRKRMAGGENVSDLPDPSKLTPPRAGNSFLNTLGLRFTPLETGSRMLICSTETRVKDFEAWLKAANGTWVKKPPFLLGDTHPAAGVTWDDAKSFCQWLTEKERQAGLIPSTAHYRLPTDLEWSLAAGLKSEAGKDSAERHRANVEHFPWPTKNQTEWKPPVMSVNLDGTRIPGFSDSFSYTAPVDKSIPNPLGLHEMGGNVSEWTEDAWPAAPDERVIRGGSWLMFERDRLLTSSRDHAPKGSARADLGFRLVLHLN